MNRYIDAFLPGMPVEAPHTQDTAEKQVTRRSPEVSPFYADLSQFRGKLPLALFTCGTEDPLLDDSVMMGAKWMAAGGEAVVRIFTGAPHGFILFPKEQCEAAGEGMDVIKAFIQKYLQ